MRVYKIKNALGEDHTELRVINPLTGRFDSTLGDEVAKVILKARGLPLGDAWKPVRVVPYLEAEYAGRPLQDFSFLHVSEPIAFSRATREALGDLLGAGEVLPLESTEGEFYVYNPPVVDALDLGNSEMDWIVEGVAAAGAYIHAFRQEVLDGIHLFKVPQLGFSHYYAGEAFVERVRRHGLTGLDIRLVWDGENPDFHDERYTDETWADLKRQFRAKRSAAQRP